MDKKLRLSSTQLRQIVIGILLIVLGGIVGYRYGLAGNDGPVPLTQVFNTETPENRQIDFGIFWEVWNYLDQTYLEPEKLDAVEMVDGAIGGMTAAIGDPYTTYLPLQQNERSAQDLAGSFYGVGIELGYIDETLAVVAPLSGTPADEAGVEAGDLILHVQDILKDLDEDTTDWTLNEAVEKIRGPKGSLISLTLLRKNGGDQYGEPFVVELKRGEIVVESVELEFVEHDGKKVAHLKVSRFGDRTAGEFNVAVNEILANGYQLSGIVLDLRNNPGGYFDGAIDLASAFIEDGIVVSQQGKFSTKDFTVSGGAKLANFKLVVVVNKGSASASEILAGALRDQIGAQLVGERTFGKGTVQDRRELSNGAGLHVTIARWLLPSGEWIHEEGIPVSVEVEDNRETPEDEILFKAIEVM